MDLCPHMNTCKHTWTHTHINSHKHKCVVLRYACHKIDHLNPITKSVVFSQWPNCHHPPSLETLALWDTISPTGSPTYGKQCLLPAPVILTPSHPSHGWMYHFGGWLISLRKISSSPPTVAWTRISLLFKAEHWSAIFMFAKFSYLVSLGIFGLLPPLVSGNHRAMTMSVLISHPGPVLLAIYSEVDYLII